MDADPIDEALRRRFERSWVEGRPEPIQRCLPALTDPRYLATLEELVHIELEFRWKSWKIGHLDESSEPAPPPAGIEHYLERFPDLATPEIIRRLIEQECLVRRQCGDPVSLEDYHQRFPGILAADVETRVFLRGAEAAATELVGRREAPPPDDGSVEEPQPGRFGNYELLEVIGRGGMGIVYRARQVSADRIVALKVISRRRLHALSQHSSSDVMGRFRQEAKAAARLEHENIVTVYEVGEVDGEPFYSMQLVQGRSLAEIVRRRPLSGRRAAGYLEPVARAVEHAHAHGILHRDLTPQNVLVDGRTDRPLVADFGLARITQLRVRMTKTGDIMGTPHYMSPEQASDSSRVTAQSDVYSLGATLYHLVTGKPPFQGARGLEAWRLLREQAPVPPRRLNPAVDRDLETICLKCLQKDPARRYPSAAELADDLRRYLNGEPIAARPAGPLRRLLRWCRRILVFSRESNR